MVAVVSGMLLILGRLELETQFVMLLGAFEPICCVLVLIEKQHFSHNCRRASTALDNTKAKQSPYGHRFEPPPPYALETLYFMVCSPALMSS